MENTGTGELMHIQASYCTFPGATIPARISPHAAICGMLHLVFTLADFDTTFHNEAVATALKSHRLPRDSVM
jgi:hypothetical protein